MAHFKVTIKERLFPRLLTSHFLGDVTEEYIIDFYGLHEPDVAWYKIEKIQGPCSIEELDKIAETIKQL